jgi:hypothetical protein
MKLKLIGFIALIAGSAFSASPEYFQAVLSGMRGSNIVSITQTETYRCIGCYGFKIETQIGTERYFLTAVTNKNLQTNQIRVKFSESVSELESL